MVARRMREWSCDGSALARCPNRRSRLFAITEVTGVDLFYASLLR